MTRQDAKELTLAIQALKRDMEATSSAYTKALVDSIGIGDRFTASSSTIKKAFEAGFRAGCTASANHILKGV